MQNQTILNTHTSKMRYKNIFLFTLIIGILTCSLLMPYIPYAGETNDNDYVQGEVLLKFKKGTSQKAANAANSKVQATLIKKLQGPSEVYHVKLPNNISVMDAIKEYEKDPNVEFAEPNYIRRVHATTTEYSLLWGIHNTGQLVNSIAGVTDADMDVLAFWNSGVGGAEGSDTVIIAVIDTGVELTHQDLDGNLWENSVEGSTADGVDDDGNGLTDDINGWDFVNSDNDPDDDNGHGTHVAGTIAAEGDNDTGITGVMQFGQIMPLKVCDSIDLCPTANIVDAINYATSRKRDFGENVKIINMSLGGYFFSNSERDAISQARDEGILVVASAGNDGTDNDASPAYPASYDLNNIISVAATDQTDGLATYGLYGAAFSSNYGATSVDVAAPGINIYSTGHTTSTPYVYMQGTSMAAPHVSGVAGLLWSVDGGLTYTQVRAAIINNVDIRQCLSGKVASSGRVNAEQARTGTVDLATPTGFTATEISTTQVNLAWTDTASEDGYNIYRKLCSDACSAYNLIYTLSAGTTTQPDTGLSPGTCYNYIIRAFTDYDPGPPVVPAERSDDATASEAISSPPQEGPTDSGHARNCFIATAAYGSPMHPYVETLREFRDKHLLNNSYGRSFVDFYYKYSPPIADVIRDSGFLKTVTRILLTPVVMFVVYPYVSMAVFMILLMSSIFTFRLIRRQKVLTT